jgi:hypothetical protein
VGEIRTEVEDMHQHPISSIPFSVAIWISKEASSPIRRKVLDLNTPRGTEAKEMILPPREEEMDMKDS